MTFEIRPFRHEDLDLIYTTERAVEVFEASRKEKSYWPQDMHRTNWAIDAQRKAYLFQLPRALSGEQSFWRYLFIVPQGMVRLEKIRYCLYEAKYVSPALRPHADAIKALIAEAFAASGEYFTGVTDPDDVEAVPHAEIINL